MKRFMILALVFAAFIAAAGAGYCAEDPSKVKETTVAKTVTGIATGVSPKFIAVEYGASLKDGAALEMAFNVDREVRIKNKRSLKDIGMGDTVTVDYDEITKTNLEGKVLSSRRVARSVSFIRPAPKEVESEVLGAESE